MLATAPVDKKRQDRPKRLIRLGLRLARWTAVALVVLLLVILFWFRNALYHRWVVFPREERAWRELRAQRQPVLALGGWHEYRGILHAHSKYSHDSQVSFEEILQVLKSTGIDFICLSDHCISGQANFDWQWRGLHDGKLFIPGFEMKEGFMPFGANPGTVLSNQTESATLARQIVEHGGVLFYAHPEEPRDWNRPELTGMEVYNIHADFKQYRGGLRSLIPEFLLNQDRYPDQFFRLIFQRPIANVERWDNLNNTRHVTGIAGNDCHQNVGFRLICAGTDMIRLEDTSPKLRKTFKLNWLTRLGARICFGSLAPGRELLHIQLDPYERMGRFVNTHVLAHALAEGEVLDALRSGRVFIGFDLIADSAGFLWWADDGATQVPMGGSATLSSKSILRACSPIPCRFTVIQNGRPAYRAEGRRLEWAPVSAGKYRVEAELRVGAEWIPWVYANPIELHN